MQGLNQNNMPARLFCGYKQFKVYPIQFCKTLVYPAQENLQNSKIAEKGFLDSCFFQLWDLGRVVGTDLKNLIVKLANKSIASD